MFRTAPLAIYSLVLAWLLVPLSNASAAVVLSQDFDSGSLNVAGCQINMSNPSAPSILLGPRYNCWTQYPDEWGWLYFRADGVLNTTPQFRVPSDGGYVFSGMTYCYSYDNVTWQYFSNNSLSSGYFYFSNNASFTQDHVYIAQSIPYPVSQTVQYMATMKANQYITPTASGDANFIVGHTHGTAGGDANGNPYYDDLGRTIPSFPLYGFKITDANAAGPKTKVVIQCGNHSCESLSHYMLEGMLQVILGNTPEGASLRQTAVFYIYPQVDPEGRWAGYWRGSPVAPWNDHNRIWADDNGLANGYGAPTQNPEVYNIEQAERLDTGGNIGYFFDIHTQTELDSYPVVTQATYSSTYIANYRLRDPNNSVQTMVWGPINMAEYWAADPLSQGGLAATYSLTPEIGTLADMSISDMRQLGAGYMLALYDTLHTGTTNYPPAVNAGVDQQIQPPTSQVSLTGSISDDGQPAGSTVTHTWSVTSGPGTVMFGNVNALSTTATFSASGAYVLRLTASDTSLWAYDECTITVRDPAGGLPYGGAPWSVPGLIQAENYDLGGQGVGYNDTDPTVNTGGAYRTSEGVDIRAINDPGGGYIVKDIFTGEWLNYTVNIAQAGNYSLGVCVATTNSGKYLHVALDGNDVTGQINITPASDWDHGVISSAQCTLPAGIHVLRLCFDTEDYNVDFYQLTLLNPINQAPVVTMPANITTGMPGAAAAGAVALNATVSDDGRANPLAINWTILSAPANGVVTFTNAGAAGTTASFNRVGTYTLQLDANDGALHTARTMTVTVNPDTAADFDQNGTVDGLDFLAWQRNYNHGTAASSAPIVDANFADANYAHAHGDANGDGKVDGSDYLIWQQGYMFGH